MWSDVTDGRARGRGGVVASTGRVHERTSIPPSCRTCPPRLLRSLRLPGEHFSPAVATSQQPCNALTHTHMHGARGLVEEWPSGAEGGARSHMRMRLCAASRAQAQARAALCMRPSARAVFTAAAALQPAPLCLPASLVGPLNSHRHRQRTTRERGGGAPLRLPTFFGGAVPPTAWALRASTASRATQLRALHMRSMRGGRTHTHTRAGIRSWLASTL